ILVHSSHLIKQEWSYSDRDSYAGLMAMSEALNGSNGGLTGFSQYLEATANKRSCKYEGELVVCQSNEHYLEPIKILGVVARSDETWQSYVGDLFKNLERLGDWMTDSLGLIRLQ